MAENRETALCRYDFLKAQYAPAVGKRLRESALYPEDDGAAFDEFAQEVDPTGALADKPWRYLGWACRQYLASEIYTEDLYKIREDLEVFEDKKKRRKLTGPEADINRYTVETLADKAEELQGPAFDSFENLWRLAPESVRKNTTIIKRDHTGVALVPHSKAAAQHWGSGTKWCTSAAEKNSMFYSYNVSGPLVILNPAGTKEWYQGHVNSPLMNARDKEAVVSPALIRLIEGMPARFLQKLERPEPDGREDWSSRDYILQKVQQEGLLLQYAPPELRADKEVILAAVRQNGYALQYAAPELRADREIVLAAVKENGRALTYAALELQADRDIVFTAIRQDGLALGSATPELKADRELVHTAVRQNGQALFYTRKLQADREVVLAAVRHSGEALFAAEPELQADREIVLAAVGQNGRALKHAASELQTDRELVLAAVRQDGGALFFAATELHADREIVLAAVQNNGLALEGAAPELQADREIVLAAMRQDDANDRREVAAAVQTKRWVHAAPELWADKAFIKQCALINFEIFDQLSAAEKDSFTPEEKHMLFKNIMAANWTAIQRVEEFGIKLTEEMQREAFIEARAKDEERLQKALHLFPALRPEFFAGELTLDEAAAILDNACVPEQKPKNTPIPRL